MTAGIALECPVLAIRLGIRKKFAAINADTAIFVWWKGLDKIKRCALSNKSIIVGGKKLFIEKIECFDIFLVHEWAPKR
jgi:hypothetical protein